MAVSLAIAAGENPRRVEKFNSLPGEERVTIRPGKPHSQILVVSWNELLLQTRRLILGTYFAVEGAGKLSEAVQRLRSTSFELVVLCDTLSDSDCLQIFRFVNGLNHRPKILLLLGPNQKRPEEIIGRTLGFRLGPMDLLRECAEMLGVDPGGRKESKLLVEQDPLRI
jgi:hypothetical protein